MEFNMQQERDAFGNWLSGFTDGEGCFYLSTKRGQRYIFLQCHFCINVRNDDIDIIRSIHNFLGCGNVVEKTVRKRLSNTCADFRVSKISDLANIVVPNFEKYPLRAKKSRDFEIWKKAVDLAYRVYLKPRIGKKSPGRTGYFSKWTDQDRQEFLRYFDEIKEIRKYIDPNLKVS
jgi:LAGLIDADG endonuclease